MLKFTWYPFQYIQPPIRWLKSRGPTPAPRKQTRSYSRSATNFLLTRDAFRIVAQVPMTNFPIRSAKTNGENLKVGKLEGKTVARFSRAALQTQKSVINCGGRRCAPASDPAFPYPWLLYMLVGASLQRIGIKDGTYRYPR